MIRRAMFIVLDGPFQATKVTAKGHHDVITRPHQHLVQSGTAQRGLLANHPSNRLVTSNIPWPFVCYPSCICTQLYIDIADTLSINLPTCRPLCSWLSSHQAMSLCFPCWTVGFSAVPGPKITGLVFQLTPIL